MGNTRKGSSLSGELENITNIVVGPSVKDGSRTVYVATGTLYVKITIDSDHCLEVTSLTPQTCLYETQEMIREYSNDGISIGYR